MTDGVRESTGLYAGFYAGCLLALLPGAALVGALVSPRDAQEWAVVAGGTLAGGAMFVTAGALCGYIPTRMLASRSVRTLAERLVRIAAVALAVGIALAVILGVITRQPVLMLWVVMSCVVWCVVPGVGLARPLSRSASWRRATVGGIAVLAVIGGFSAAIA